MHEARFALVTAAHHFLTAALPLREPQSREALNQFTARAAQAPLCPADIEVVLVRCLAVIERRSLKTLPGLVNTYLVRAKTPSDGLPAFRSIVVETIRYHGFADRAASTAIS